MGINTIRQMATGATISSPFGCVLRLQLSRDLLPQRGTGADSRADGGHNQRVTAAGGYVQLLSCQTEMLGKVSSLVLQLTGIAAAGWRGRRCVRAFAVWSGQYSFLKANAAKAQSAANALVVFNAVFGVVPVVVLLP